MRSSTFAIIALAARAFASASSSSGSEDAKIAESSELFDSLKDLAFNSTIEQLTSEPDSLGKRNGGRCHLGNISIRREFGSLSKAERKAYTDAILCLQSKPARTPAAIAAGAKSRFDDFVVTHIQQTLNIHYTGTFLGWHRYYIHIYEEALKNECGYKGALPYWEWSKWANSPQTSPLFNGDAFSMSGNGQYLPDKPPVVLIPAFPGLGTEPITIPRGLGGGCVTTGPFKNYTVNLGPIGVQDVPPGPDFGLGYNPRCLVRDIGPGVAIKYTNWTAVATTLSQKTIEDFQLDLQGRPGAGTIGIHGGGHYTIGGDPGGDIFVSPADPAFYLHHAQIDRIWTIWQALNPSQKYKLSGTNTFLNIPPSPNTTLDDTFNLGYAGGETVKVREGTTACLFGVNHSVYEVRIGNSDIYDLVRDSLNKFTQSFDGLYRMRAWGSADYDGDLVQNGSAELKWGISNTFA